MERGDGSGEYDAPGTMLGFRQVGEEIWGSGGRRDEVEGKEGGWDGGRRFAREGGAVGEGLLKVDALCKEGGMGARRHGRRQHVVLVW